MDGVPGGGERQFSCDARRTFRGDPPRRGRRMFNRRSLSQLRPKTPPIEVPFIGTYTAQRKHPMDTRLCTGKGSLQVRVHSVCVRRGAPYGTRAKYHGQHILVFHCHKASRGQDLGASLDRSHVVNLSFENLLLRDPFEQKQEY